MSVLSFLAVCTAAFLFGMLVGIVGNFVKKTTSRTAFKNDAENLTFLAISNCEYRNFLNYDGTEQN